MIKKYQILLVGIKKVYLSDDTFSEYNAWFLLEGGYPRMFDTELDAEKHILSIKNPLQFTCFTVVPVFVDMYTIEGIEQEKKTK